MSEAFENNRPYSQPAGPSQEWDGIVPSKFRYPERKHYGPKDMMKNIEGMDPDFLGRKHFEPTYGVPKKDKLSIRPFPELQNSESIRKEQHIKTKPEVRPSTRPYGHKERLHLSQDRSKEAEYRAQVKTFYPMQNDNKEVNLEKQMGKKRLIDCVEDQRNLIELRSLGDKPYKYPEYSAKFYHEGGLIAGSSNKVRETKKLHVKKPSEQTANKTKGMTWKDRVKLEEKTEEEEAVKSLSVWEQTTLKEGNPKWRDPDAVEPEPPKKVDPKANDPKNVKKAAPPKK